MPRSPHRPFPFPPLSEQNSNITYSRQGSLQKLYKMDSQEQKTVLDTINHMWNLRIATRNMIFDQHTFGDNTANEFITIEHEIRLLHKGSIAVCDAMNQSQLELIEEGLDLRTSEESWEIPPATAISALEEVRGILDFLIDVLHSFPEIATRPVPEYHAIFDGQFVNALHYMQEDPHWSEEELLLSDLGYSGDDTSSSDSGDEEDNPMPPNFHLVGFEVFYLMIGAQPVIEEGIRTLEVHVAGNNEQLECPICLQSIGQGQDMKILPCSHKYHADCIDTWLRNSATCPMDRSNPFAQ